MRGRASHVFQQGQGDGPVLANPGQFRQSGSRLRMTGQSFENPSVLLDGGFHVVQTFAINLGSLQGQLDRFRRVRGVARGTGQIGGGPHPLPPLAVQLDQGAQCLRVGGIGRHGRLQCLLCRRRIPQIFLVPARHGHQHLSALGRGRDLRQALLALRQQVRPAIVNRGHTRQIGGQVESRRAFLESDQHDHECAVGIPQIGLVDLCRPHEAAAALSRIQRPVTNAQAGELPGHPNAPRECTRFQGGENRRWRPVPLFGWIGENRQTDRGSLPVPALPKTGCAPRAS